MHNYIILSSTEPVSLIGKCPKETKYNNLYVWNNYLTSLKGSPMFVRQSFICSINKITALLYFPKIVEELVHADFNNLLCLDYIPQLSCTDPLFPLFINY